MSPFSLFDRGGEARKMQDDQLILIYYHWIPSESSTTVLSILAVSKPETEAELGTFLKAPSSRSNYQLLQPAAIAEDYIEVLTPCNFIENPISRVIASVKFLCGDYGVLVEEFISWYIAEQGISKIIEQVFEVIDVEFMQWLALPQAKRAEAAESTLQPLDVKSNRKAVYMSLLKVPERARFWDNFRHAFPEGAVDESRNHMMMYIGSATDINKGTKIRIGKHHENPNYCKNNPNLFDAAMDEPGTFRKWLRVGVAKTEESRALMRIVEAVAIATTHTYTSIDCSSLLKEYGIVEKSSVAFGCSRTGAMKDFSSNGHFVLTSAVQRVLYQVSWEKYGGPLWTYDSIPELVETWLREEGFDKDQIGALADGEGIPLARAIHTEMPIRGGQALQIKRALFREEELTVREGKEITVKKGELTARKKGESTVKKGKITVEMALAGDLRVRVRGLPNSPQVTILSMAIYISSQLVKDGLVKIGDEVNVEFPISDCRNQSCYAEDALFTDSGYRLGIHVRGVDVAGKEWHRHLGSAGEKAVKKANTISDWLTIGKRGMESQK
ncbi:MAG: hypothetical protein ASARMPREDX12_009544 [Alectoria sarmentosa]|nr:MAG: hypothetical protein ASARMPREDX12_009544 [Alectoria sarmentosa]